MIKTDFKNQGHPYPPLWLFILLFMNSMSLGETLSVLYANKWGCFHSPVVKGTVLERIEETGTGHRGAVTGEFGSHINFAGYPGWNFNEIYSFSSPTPPSPKMLVLFYYHYAGLRVMYYMLLLVCPSLQKSGNWGFSFKGSVSPRVVQRLPASQLLPDAC